MSDRATRFFGSVERSVGQAAVSAAWRHALGEDWRWARSLLRPTDQLAGCFPKLDEGAASPSAYRVVWRDEAADRYLGSCPDGTGTVELRRADLVVHELDRRAVAGRVAGRVASALGLVGDFSELEEPAHACRVGVHSPMAAGEEAWVYLATPPGAAGLSAAVATLAGRHPGAFVLPTFTRSLWRGWRETLRRQGAVAALDELIEIELIEIEEGGSAASPSAEGLFARLRSKPEAAGGGGAGADGGGAVFRPHGGARLLGFGGETAAVGESKGCKYLAFLLANPGKLLHAAEVRAGAEGRLELAGLGRERGLSQLDGPAWADARRKYEQLIDELGDARLRGDEYAAARAEADVAALAARMGAAQGKGGKGRKLDDAAEKARKAVGNAVERALEAIRARHVPLWRHLDGAVHRGIFLRYDPPEHVAWQI